MTTVPLSGPVRSMAKLGGRHRTDSSLGSAAPKDADQGRRAHCGQGAYRHRLR
jgi:hypothetical protein